MISENSIWVYYANLDDLDFEKMQIATCLSAQVKQFATTLISTKQKRYLACRYLLALIMQRYFDADILPLMAIGENKKPFFVADNLPHFNISHSGDYVAVAVATKGNVGLDIEQQRSRNNLHNIAAQFFSPTENDWLIAHPKPVDAFWHLWTLREATLKLYAKGVWQMKQIAIFPETHTIQAPFVEQIFPFYQQVDQIHLSVCSDHAKSAVFITPITEIY